jgi:DNA-binding transcriptional regulator LsrR (DeoR family)
MRADAKSSGRNGPKGRPGRPSLDDYSKRVTEVLRRTPFELEECAVLAQLPGVQRLAKLRVEGMVPIGTAIHTLIERAVSDVEELAVASGDRTSKRVATFLQLWFRERQTVVQVAGALGLSRTHVAREVQRRAVALVARRFLELAWRPEVPA